MFPEVSNSFRELIADRPVAIPKFHGRAVLAHAVEQRVQLRKPIFFGENAGDNCSKSAPNFPAERKGSTDSIKESMTSSSIFEVSFTFPLLSASARDCKFCGNIFSGVE